MLESSIQKEQCCHDLLEQCSQGLSSVEQQIQQTGLQATGACSQRDNTKALAVSTVMCTDSHNEHPKQSYISHSVLFARISEDAAHRANFECRFSQLSHSNILNLCSLYRLPFCK